MRRESVERIPLGSQCEGEEEGGGGGGGGGEQVSTVDAERELRAKEEERFILIISPRNLAGRPAVCVGEKPARNGVLSG